MRQRDLQQALLRGASINDTAFATLVRALNDCPSLQTLDLSQCLGAEVNIVAGLDWVNTMKQLRQHMVIWSQKRYGEMVRVKARFLSIYYMYMIYMLNHAQRWKGVDSDGDMDVQIT